MNFKVLLVPGDGMTAHLFRLTPIDADEFTKAYSSGGAASVHGGTLIGMSPRDPERHAQSEAEGGRVRPFDRSVITPEATAFILPLFAGRNQPDPEREHLAFTIADAIGPKNWQARRIHDDGDDDQTLLLRLVDDFALFRLIQLRSGGYTKKVTAVQLKSVESRAGRLAKALSELPADTLVELAGEGTIGFVLKLQSVAEEARKTLGTQVQIGWAKGAKLHVEETLAFSLGLYGVPVTRYRKADHARGGVHDRVLRAAYQDLGIRAGVDTLATLRRLRLKWTPEAVKNEARRRRKDVQDRLRRRTSNLKNR